MEVKDKKAVQPLDLKAMAEEIAAAVKGSIKADADAEAAAEQAAKDAAERIENTATTAAERLVKDLREEILEQNKDLGEVLKGLQESVKAMAEDGSLEEAFLKDRSTVNKMKFVKDEKDLYKNITSDQRDGLMYASKLLKRPIPELENFKRLVTKSGMEHWDSSVVGEWEDEYSTRVQNALRETLVVEPLFTSIPMVTPTMNMPINPDAGNATWVNDAALRSSRNPSDETGDGTDTSTGAAQDHQIDEQTLIARKLATREYIGYEEEEDSIVALAPIINDAVARRMSRESDLALLRGVGNLTATVAYDPITGIVNRGALTTDVEVTGGANWEANVTEDHIVDMRRNLGLYGLDPSRLILLCSHDYYYELMKLTNFKTVDVLGPLATILTGQVGSIFGVKTLVSQQFDNAAIAAGTLTTALATMVYPANFIKGQLRGIMTETDRDVINQKRVIVSSRRFAFQDIITGAATINYNIAS